MKFRVYIYAHRVLWLDRLLRFRGNSSAGNFSTLHRILRTSQPQHISKKPQTDVLEFLKQEVERVWIAALSPTRANTRVFVNSVCIYICHGYFGSTLKKGVENDIKHSSRQIHWVCKKRASEKLNNFFNYDIIDGKLAANLVLTFPIEKIAAAEQSKKSFS